MDIKSNLPSALLLLLILLTGFQCSNEAKRIERIPETAFIDECPDRIYDFGEMVTVGDPGEKFMIHLPYSWDIRESYGDSLYGVFASNFLSIPKPLDERMSLSVSGYSTEKELDEYFIDELAGLARDEKTTLLERGSSMFGGKKNPWILFRMEGGIYNMVYYIKDPGEEDIFLIQAVTYDTVNYKVKLCYLKQLVNSFERIRYQ